MKYSFHQKEAILNLNIKCSQHKFNESEFVYFKPKAKNVFICSRCVFESNGIIEQSDLCLCLIFSHQKTNYGILFMWRESFK